MFSPLFEFFEVIADELSAENSRVLTRTDLQIRDEDSPLLDELKRGKWVPGQLTGVSESRVRELWGAKYEGPQLDEEAT